MDTFSCFTAPRDACPPLLRPSAYSLALKSGLDCGIISMRLQGKTVEIAAQYRRFYRYTQKRATVKGRCMWLERVLQEVTLHNTF